MAFQPHLMNFVLIPYMGPGHLIPMIDMAKSLAIHGLNVKIILTHLAAKRFSSVVNRAVMSGLSIELLEIRFPCEEAGLPPGCEIADCIPAPDLFRNFYVAITMLQEPVEKMLKEMSPSPSCIIGDKHVPWTADTCKKLDIPRIVFDGMSCTTELVMHNVYASMIGEGVSPGEPFVVPGLPDEFMLAREQLLNQLHQIEVNYPDLFEDLRRTESEGYGMVINSFEELEQRYVDEFRKVKGGKVWCIGPLFLCSSDDELDKAERGNRASSDSDQCLKWLDDMKPGSVVYACLGSQNRLSLSQFIELALGLEMSSHPFILVVRGESSGEREKWILDDGFEERIKGRGLLLRGWAPQLLIMSHPSIGGFLTHCGWNSTLEGICSGLPLITWSLFGDQLCNEKLVQGLGIGVGVGARREEEEKPENVVHRDGIKAAIERVMDKGKEGSEIRKKAQEFGEIAKRSVGVGGSSYLNTLKLIEEIAELSKSKKQIVG